MMAMCMEDHVHGQCCAKTTPANQRIAELEADLHDAKNEAESARRAAAAENVLRLDAEAEVERLRMQLAACGVAANDNLDQPAQRIAKSNPNWSAAYGDVCRAVDRETALRIELATERAKRCGTCRYWQLNVANLKQPTCTRQCGSINIVGNPPPDFACNRWEAKL